MIEKKFCRLVSFTLFYFPPRQNYYSRENRDKLTWFGVRRIAAMQHELSGIARLESIAKRESRRSICITLSVEFQNSKRRAIRTIRECSNCNMHPFIENDYHTAHISSKIDPKKFQAERYTVSRLCLHQLLYHMHYPRP